MKETMQNEEKWDERDDRGAYSSAQPNAHDYQFCMRWKL